MFVAIPTAMPPEPLTSRFGNRGRQDDGLLLVPVVVRDEVDGLRIDVAEQLHARSAPAALPCSAWQRGGIAVDGAEVAVRVDRVGGAATSPVPCRTRASYTRLVAVRVVLLHDLADGRTRTCGAAGPAAGPTRASTRAIRRWTGFRPSRTSGQRPTDDDRHRVVEVRALDLVLQLDRLDVPREQTFL